MGMTLNYFVYYKQMCCITINEPNWQTQETQQRNFIKEDPTSTISAGRMETWKETITPNAREKKTPCFIHKILILHKICCYFIQIIRAP